MTDAADPRLQRLLGSDALATVRRRLRRHYERAEAGIVVNSLRLVDLEPDAHAALCQVTGQRARTARSMTLDLAALDARLREAGLADSLKDALERLEGPIAATAALRRERIARWAAIGVPGAADPRLRAWRDTPAAATLLKRVAREPDRATALLEAADTVLRRLPAAGLTRSQLAAETLGDAHALDAARPVATIVLAVLRQATQRQRIDEGEERVRDVWARAGVLVSELARPALVLNLPDGDASCPWVAGEPAYLSLRYLLRRQSPWPVAGRTVHVCENPDVVAIAADRLDVRCAPLVCTDGMPAAAQRVLLDQLVGGGARLRYHGDYDWAGLGIGNFVVCSWSAHPWRYGTAEYLAAIERAAQRPRDLDDCCVTAVWDAALAPAMREHGLAVAEEAVADQLVEDLRSDD